ncbi:NADH-Ubiquinone oxidoreductase, chain 5 [Ancylostoma caninum]|uniref:NADH-ubiquinone oxidoreductase chain 4L n=1 Tax=Ancylostoma caninum TaxID=29170 RepID=A0A368F7W0_ANCCA|nr:NADH-Ubiquinone oxidoreductase, chain 5 [Ancylostoma caninum]
MTLSLVLFLIGILGFILNRKNIILMIISIEMMLLAVTLLVLVSSYQFDDIMGQTYSVYIIAIAGAESAIGLGILVAYYRLRAGLLGRKLGVTGAHIITTGCLMSSALLSLVAFYEVGLCNSPVSIELFSWIDSESLLVQWGFLFDSLTVSMLLPVLVVSSLVHLYSVSYMAEDPHNQRFFSYLSMFTFFMLVLVAGDNYLILFVGWEGIGISSFLLINFWYTRIQANKSEKKIKNDEERLIFKGVGVAISKFKLGLK